MPGELLRAAYAKRFWPKVDKAGPTIRPELGPCWVWTAATTNGYGVLGSGGGRGRPLRAHRVAFFIEHGRWPKPYGMHRCDNRACVRHDHIVEGTPADNNRDRVAKGRSNYRVGERHSRAKLSDVQVADLRKHATEGASVSELARAFAISERSARHFVCGTRR